MIVRGHALFAGFEGQTGRGAELVDDTEGRRGGGGTMESLGLEGKMEGGRNRITREKLTH